MTNRPKITAENFEQVYDYYKTSRISPRFNQAVFAVSDKLYAPDALIGDEARDAIETQFALGKGAIMAINHPSPHDPFVSAGAMHQTGITGFREFTGFAKDSLFHGLTLPIFEKTGCVPVFRHKSYPDLSLHDFARMAESLMALAVHHLREGNNVSMMPEGTYSQPDELVRLKKQSIKSGIARIAQYATDNSSFIVPVGIRYRTNNAHETLLPRHAAVVFGTPITTYASSPGAIKAQVYEGMQASLTEAVTYVRTTT
jgi:1-acyl-sn-glycerol-3-phosphate acyltransferase